MTLLEALYIYTRDVPVPLFSEIPVPVPGLLIIPVPVPGPPILPVPVPLKGLLNFQT